MITEPTNERKAMKSKKSLHVGDCIDLLRSALHALESGDHGKAETPMPLGYQDLLEIIGDKYDSMMDRRAGVENWPSKIKRVRIRKRSA